MKSQHYDSNGRDPRRAKKLEVAAWNKKTLKFENDAERRDYERLLTSNPKNDGLYGYPPSALFPPLKKREAFSSADVEVDPATCKHRWSNTQECFCVFCFTEKPTEERENGSAQMPGM